MRYSIFCGTVALSKDPTATELHGGQPKVLSVCSIGNLNSTPPITYYQGKDCRPDNLASKIYGDI